MRKRITAMPTSYCRPIGCHQLQLRQPIFATHRHAVAPAVWAHRWAVTQWLVPARKRRASVSASMTIRRISNHIILIITAPAVTKPVTKRIKCWNVCRIRWHGSKDWPVMWNQKVPNLHQTPAIRIKVFFQKYSPGEFRSHQTLWWRRHNDEFQFKLIAV